MSRLTEINRKLSQSVALRFSSPVAFVYNPLDYAWESHKRYLSRFGQGEKLVLFLGMNPGPFGMAQTGVPFGDVEMVRDWMGIEAPIGRPAQIHPKRPVAGFECPRGEVSGQRFWGWARDRFGNASSFFDVAFVANYCPLLFLEESGRNLTPDKLPAAESEALFAACDEALRGTVRELQPEWLVGIGKFAEARARRVFREAPKDGIETPKIASILHPSPASPAANRGWREAAEKQLEALGLRFFLTGANGSDLTTG